CEMSFSGFAKIRKLIEFAFLHHLVPFWGVHVERNYFSPVKPDLISSVFGNQANVIPLPGGFYSFYRARHQVIEITCAMLVDLCIRMTCIVENLKFRSRQPW